MAKMPKKLSSWLIPKLRNISRWWPGKQIARDAAKVRVQIGYYQNGNPEYRTKYRCNGCKELFDSNEIQMDHIIPTVDVKGFDNWDETLTRLFCNPEGYQALCIFCHTSKTESENIERVENRKINKKLKK